MMATPTSSNSKKIDGPSPGPGSPEFEMADFRLLIESQFQHVDSLLNRLEALSQRESQLLNQLQGTQNKVRELDEANQYLTAQLADRKRELAEQQERVRHLTARQDELLNEIDKMKSTRVWQLGLCYWSLLAIYKILFRRR